MGNALFELIKEEEKKKSFCRICFVWLCDAFCADNYVFILNNVNGFSFSLAVELIEKQGKPFFTVTYKGNFSFIFKCELTFNLTHHNQKYG